MSKPNPQMPKVPAHLRPGGVGAKADTERRLAKAAAAPEPAAALTIDHVTGRQEVYPVQPASPIGNES